MSTYLSQIDIAISPFIGRVSKAINFYDSNKVQNTNQGLFLCLGAGLDKWTTGVDEEKLPDLHTMEIDTPFMFIRYSKMYFVTSDIDGKINVGNLTWTKVPYGADEDEYLKNVRNSWARWLYVEFQVTEDTFITTAQNTVRQIGIYEKLKLNDTADPNNTVFLPEQIEKITDTTDNRDYNGYLTLIQNCSAYQLQKNSLWSYVLEF